MSLLKDAWQGLQAVASLVDKVERQDRQIEALRAELQDARERLAAVEAIIDFARGQRLKPPPKR